MKQATDELRLFRSNGVQAGGQACQVIMSCNNNVKHELDIDASLMEDE